MSLEDLGSDLIGLEQVEFERFLIRLTHALTVAARDSYRPEPILDESAFEKLRTINELIHTIGNKQARDLHGSSFPKETFWEILNKVAGTRCASELDWAIRFALDRPEPA